MAVDFSGSVPVFERRGYMLDVSRDRVPTRDTLAWLVGVLAALRYNELQLYVEHSFAYTGHEVVWRDASPLTHADMRWLDALCRERGIDLVANMNCFGHMGRWLEHDAYRARAECPDGAPGLFREGTMAPTCLAPTPENAAFGIALAREMASVVTHRRIHIGGDEPFELGDGVSAAEVATRGRDRVYLDHLLRILEPLLDAGHEVMFWADLFRRDRALLADVPDGAIGVVWNYEAPSEADEGFDALLPEGIRDRLGLPKDAHLGFESHARLFVERGTPFWVAPGTASWNTIIGRNANAAANIADAVAAGAANASPGILLTDWGDNGHWQPLPVSLPSLVRCAFGAWEGGAPAAERVAVAIDAICGFEAGTGAWIDALGHASERLGLRALNSNAICNAVRSGYTAYGDIDAGALGEVRATVEVAARRCADASGANGLGGPRGAIAARELEAACALAEIGLQRIAAAHGLASAVPSHAAIERAVALQRAAWLLGSRPGGLDDSLARVERSAGA